MRVERLTDEYWKDVWSGLVPEHYLGMRLVDDRGDTVCLGGIFWWIDKWWATFHDFKDVPTSVHRYAIKVREAAREAGIDTLWAIPDPKIAKAVPWIKRHGFVFDHVDAEGFDVWRLDLGPNHDGSDCLGSRHRAFSLRSGS